jgi:hypothetical protein
MLLCDAFNFAPDSFYFLKNEKMILLLQILERGSDYCVYTVKGTELQETTVCHAEENSNINEILKDVVENKSCNPYYTFSLSPVR